MPLSVVKPITGAIYNSLLLTDFVIIYISNHQRDVYTPNFVQLKEVYTMVKKKYTPNFVLKCNGYSVRIHMLKSFTRPLSPLRSVNLI